MNHLDLFSGIGGFTVAARWAGFSTTQMVERNRFCQRLLIQNFPGIPIHGDIATFYPDGYWDIITAGFPCQPHSLAGKRQASEDERDMWPELRRVIRAVCPRWIVLENVVGLLSSESGRYFREILWDLAQMGFDAEWGVISACSLGATHTRERVFIVAYADSEQRQVRRMGLHFEHDKLLQLEHQAEGFSVWEMPHPRASGMADGLPHKMDRLKAIGNSIPPEMAFIPLQAISRIYTATGATP